jgi:hypothetical protein
VEQEQLELGTDAPVVALLGGFDPREVLGELLRVLERDAVDALQHLVVLVAAPIRARQLGELPRADLPGALHVRAAAQVDEVAVAEDGDVLARGDVGEPRDLQVLPRAT